MIIPGLAMILFGLVAIPSLGGSGQPGTVVPGTPGTPGDNGEEPGNPGIPGTGIAEIPSVGFWVHNDPLALNQF